MLINTGEIKSMKVGARVTPGQKRAIQLQMKKFGYVKESEYVLACCLKGTGESLVSSYKLQQLDQNNNNRIEFRVTNQEREEILLKFKESGLFYLGRFIRNCCLGNPIISIEGMKELSTELHKVGNNLNQLTMLCHQGLISNPDITETTDILKKIYKDLAGIKLKSRLRR